MTHRSERVREIGEFELIRRLTERLPASVRAGHGMAVGIGDDAAVWTPNAGREIAITTDALIEGVHFRLDWTDFTSLGHKMLAVNLSDIAAMGARPRIATIVLGLTGEELVADLEALYVGAGALASAHDVKIVGGDVVRTPHELMLGVTVLGEVSAGEAIRRSGAQPGDLVVVSGALGASAAGMALLARGIDSTTTGPLLTAAHLRPNPRLALGAVMFRSGVTAAMDLSDGLLGDLPRIMESSGVSAEVDVSAIPMLPAIRALFPDECEQFALRGGEDYELLMTIPENRFDAFKLRASELDATIKAIGKVGEATGQPQLTLRKGGLPYDAGAGAFDHFRS